MLPLVLLPCRHAHAVIGYGQEDFIVLFPAADQDGSPAAAFFHDSMDNGIFYQGLQCNFWDQEPAYLVVHIDLKQDFAPEALLLDGNVGFTKLDFQPDGDDILPLIQYQLVIPGQGKHGFPDIIHLIPGGHPVDHIQGVV